MKRDSLLRLIREVVFGNPQLKQQERIEDAVRDHAKLISDADYHRIMANYYTARAATIDPNNDWWGYASVKQKEYDNVQEHARYVERATEAGARVEAEQARAVRLYNGPDVAGSEGQA